MAGRHKGIKLTFEEAYAYATRWQDYWTRRGDKGVWAAWQADYFLGAARSEAGAKDIVVRSFEKELKGAPK